MPMLYFVQKTFLLQYTVLYPNVDVYEIIVHNIQTD